VLITFGKTVVFIIKFLVPHGFYGPVPFSHITELQDADGHCYKQIRE